MREVFVVVMVSLVTAGCATGRPNEESAPACLTEASWVDRIEGDVAIVIDPNGEARSSTVIHLPVGAQEGSALVDGVLAPDCAARVRGYVRRLQQFGFRSRDSPPVLRLD